MASKYANKTGKKQNGQIEVFVSPALPVKVTLDITLGHGFDLVRFLDDKLKDYALAQDKALERLPEGKDKEELSQVFAQVRNELSSVSASLLKQLVEARHKEAQKA